MVALEHSQRLRVAAHIKAIADADPFEAWRAEEIDRLLCDLPRQKMGLSWHSLIRGPSTGGYAPGIGDISVPGDEKQKELSFGMPVARCGAYLVAKLGDREFETRHVMDVDAEFESHQMMLLAVRDGRWRAFLNAPRTLSLGFLRITFGSAWVPWKDGGQSEDHAGRGSES